MKGETLSNPTGRQWLCSWTRKYEKTVFSSLPQLSSLVFETYGHQSLCFIHEKNLTIHRLSTPSMILIAQSMAEKRGTLLLLSSFGHPV